MPLEAAHPTAPPLEATLPHLSVCGDRDQLLGFAVPHLSFSLSA